MENSRTYMSPTLRKEFIYHYWGLCIHQRGRPDTPFPPFLDIFYSTHQTQKGNKKIIVRVYAEEGSTFPKKKKNFLIIPRDRTKPPNAKSRSVANDSNVFATIMFRPVDAISRNNADAIWLTIKRRRYCLNNLQWEDLFYRENMWNKFRQVSTNS